MGTPCRRGCGRTLASVLGERSHASRMHGAQQPTEQPAAGHVCTVCIESDDSIDSTGEVPGTGEVAGSNPVPRDAGVRHVLGLESQVFLELARTMTAPPPSQPRRGRARRGAPSESARRSRRAVAQNHQQRRHRRSRRGRGGPSQPDGSVGDDEESGSDSAPRRGGGATGGGAAAGEPGPGGSPTGGDPDRELCEDVFDFYERFGDARRATTAFPPYEGKGTGDRSSPWLQDDLWPVFTFACTSRAGGGMSQKELRRLYGYTKTLEAGTGASKKPFTDTFKSANRFVAAVRRFKRALIAPLDWKKVVMNIDGRQYPVFFRDAIDVVQEKVMAVELGDLCWGEDEENPAVNPPSPSSGMDTASTDGTPQSILLRGAWDGEMYREQRAHVEGTIQRGTRVLGMHLYSDATVLSSSGAVSAYPLRMRVVNINTEQVRWVTLAFIPQVEAKFLETRKGSEVRSELLQRILHVVFRRSMLASHRGVWLDLPGGGQMRVSPRPLLYVCDQPEERAVMFLKATGCLFPCTPCMAGRADSCSAEGGKAPSRDVDETVGAQLDNATMGDFRGAAARRTEVELEHSLNSVVPAMAAWAGLGSGPRMLYRLPGFDRLHVRISFWLAGLLATPEREHRGSFARCDRSVTYHIVWHWWVRGLISGWHRVAAYTVSHRSWILASIGKLPNRCPSTSAVPPTTATRRG